MAVDVTGKYPQATFTIPNGSNLSEILELPLPPVGIIFPAAWTAAALTFNASGLGGNGVTPVPFYNSSGELSIPSASIGAAESRYVALDPMTFLGARTLQLVSGTHAAGVNQGASRVLIVVLKRIALGA